MKKKIMRLITLTIVAVLTIILVKPIVKPELKANFLKDELKELKSYMKYGDSIDQSVSKVPVSWHIDHVLLTINGIYKVMDTSSIENYKSRFSFGRTMMFTFNRIPRGSAESPKQVRPTDYTTKDSISSHFKLTDQLILKFDSLPEKAHFKHPYIGILKRKQAKRFLKIHTNHHLEIVRDILKR